MKGRQDIPQAKKKLVSDITKMIDESPVVAVVNMENLPAKQLANMRGQLRGKVQIVMTKKRLLKIAIDKSKRPDIKALEKHLKGMPALILTKDNPFSLYGLLKKKRSNAPIKGGQKTPIDIVVHAGTTNFAPGPVIGELGGFKIKAGIEAGKVVIKEDKTVAHEGDVIEDKLAGLLLRLGIEPMQIGLNLVAAYENGMIMDSKVLDIDETVYASNVRLAASEAFHLAMFAGIMTADTTIPLITKAQRESMALAREANILTKETVGESLAKAEAQGMALQGMINQ